MQIDPVVPTALSPRYTTSEPVLDMLIVWFSSGFENDDCTMLACCGCFDDIIHM